MNTKFIGIKDFRQNIALYAKEARSKKNRLVVMSRNTPLFAIEPFDEGENFESLYNKVNKAKADIVAGRTYSQDEIMLEFGVK
jgi:PHD/YefM family antitoxin component YafN of YafNO toxin-antitoxin module